jgi:hypothetical protein
MIREAASSGVVHFGREGVAMEFVCKRKIEKAWLVSSVVMFVAHRLLEFPSPGHYSDSTPLGMWLEMAMIVLSFPLGGLTLFALHIASFWCGDCRNLEFLFDWSTLLFAGYIQWFWVLPEVMRSRELTFLDLRRPLGTVSPDASPASTEPSPAPFEATPCKAAPPVALEAEPLPVFDAASFVPCRAEFDEAGLTALDRVFKAQAPPQAPAASSSHAETIFPRVS